MMCLLGASPMIKKVKAKRKHFFPYLTPQKNMTAHHIAIGNKLGTCANRHSVDIVILFKFILGWK